jgi:hypothetical protein
MKIRPLHHPAGFTSLGFLGYMTILGLLIIGGQGVYVALKNSEPLEITVSDYLAKKPNAEWMTLKDAEICLVEAAYKARLGRVAEVFIPIRPVGESKEAPVHILLSTEDQAVASALKSLGQSAAPMNKKVDAAAHQADRLFMRQDITGLTRYGILYDLFMRTRLARLNMNLAEDFVILNDGESPDFTVNLCMVGAGLLIWFLMLCSAMSDALWRWRRRRAFYRQRNPQ